MSTKARILVLTLAAAVMLLPGCTTYKQYGYLQDIKKATLREFSTNYEAVIKKDDRLMITVFASDPKVAAPYNLGWGENGGGIAGGGGMYGDYYSYLVDKRGEITFPVLGTIKVEGMTRRELEYYLMDRIGEDVKNPTVIVSFRNYTITVLGDVHSPGEKQMNEERISIFKAISMAGDLSITARRDNILIVREVKGKPTYHVVNLKKAETLSDEWYYLQQNDIVYVVPGTASDTTRTVGFWMSLIGSLSSLSAVALAALAFFAK